MAAFWVLALFGVISAALTLWVAYRVIRAAVRDGVNDSELAALLRKGRNDKQATTAPMHLDDMRAD